MTFSTRRPSKCIIVFNTLTGFYWYRNFPRYYFLFFILLLNLYNNLPFQFLLYALKSLFYKPPYIQNCIQKLS